MADSDAFVEPLLTTVVDVAIIGAGVSGLSAALACKDAGVCDFIVLEAKNRVGGRTLSINVETATGPRIMHYILKDLGGQWIGRTQHDALSLLERYRLQLHPQFRTGQSVMRLADGRVRKFSGTIPQLSPLELVNLLLVQSMVDWHAATVDGQHMAQTPRAAEFDRHTVASMVSRFNLFANIRALVDVICRVSFGCEADQMSYLYFLSYVKSAGNFDALLESNNGGGQEFRIKGGAQQLSERMLDDVGPDRVRLLCPVVQVVHDDSGVTLTCEDGSVIRAKHAIFAVPPHLVAGVAFYPPLPIAKRAVTQNSPVGHLIKILVTFKVAFWRVAGFSGEGIFDGDVLCVCFDASLHDGEPALVCFIGGKNATNWAAQDPAARQAAVLADLAAVFGPGVYDYLAFVDKDWTAEPYNGGCPVDRLVTGTRSVASELAKPVGRLHFAGTETATHWKGFISGAVQAGRRAAGEALGDLAPAWTPPRLAEDYAVPPYPSALTSAPRFAVPRLTPLGSALAVAVVGTAVLAVLRAAGHTTGVV